MLGELSTDGLQWFVHNLVTESNVQKPSLTRRLRKDFQSYPFLVLPLPRRGTEAMSNPTNSFDVIELGHALT
jgi:hypothetical protein